MDKEFYKVGFAYSDHNGKQRVAEQIVYGYYPEARDHARDMLSEYPSKIRDKIADRFTLGPTLGYLFIETASVKFLQPYNKS